MQFLRKYWKLHKTNRQTRDTLARCSEKLNRSAYSQNTSQDHNNYMVSSMSFSPADISCKVKRLQPLYQHSLLNHSLCPDTLSVWVQWMYLDKWRFQTSSGFFIVFWYNSSHVPGTYKYIFKKVNSWELHSLLFQRNYKREKSNTCCLCWKIYFSIH